MYACPWCERKVFSFWQKQSLGPSKTVECTACKRRVAVDSARAQLAMIPLFLMVLAGLWFIGDAFNSKVFAIAGAFCGLVVGMIFMMPIYHYLVPLVKQRR
jgi:positive regulator of sigma E activity